MHATHQHPPRELCARGRMGTKVSVRMAESMLEQMIGARARARAPVLVSACFCACLRGSISVLYRERRRPVYCAGVDVPVLKMTASARVFEWSMVHAKRMSVRVSVRISVLVPITRTVAELLGVIDEKQAEVDDYRADQYRGKPPPNLTSSPASTSHRTTTSNPKLSSLEPRTSVPFGTGKNQNSRILGCGGATGATRRSAVFLGYVQRPAFY